MANQKPFVGEPALFAYKDVFPDAELTPAMEHMIVLEGFSPEKYKDTKDISTIGVGLTGKYFPQEGETLHDAFMRAYADKEAKARDLIKNYDQFSPELQTQIMSGIYRGDLSGSPKTLDYINQNNWDMAAEEFLNHDEYRNPDTPKGIKKRMEEIAKAFKNNSLVSLPSKPVSSQSAELFVSGAMAPRGNPTRERQMLARAISNG